MLHGKAGKVLNVMEALSYKLMPLLPIVIWPQNLQLQGQRQPSA